MKKFRKTQIVAALILLAGCDSANHLLNDLVNRLLGIKEEAPATPQESNKKPQKPFQPVDYTPFLKKGNERLSKKAPKKIGGDVVGREIVSKLKKGNFVAVE